VSFQLHIGTSVMHLEDLPLIRAIAHYEPEGLYDHCRSSGGVHESGGKCWLNERLASLCVQVTFVGGSWRLAQRTAGEGKSYGCTYKGGHWESVEYSTVPYVKGEEGTWQELQNGTVHFEGLSIEVRSAADPLFVALELTRGSLDFGWTEAEEDILGIVLMILGIVFGARPCFTCCRAMRGNRRKDPWRASRRPRLSRAAAEAARAARLRREPNPETVGMRHAQDAQDEMRI